MKKKSICSLIFLILSIIILLLCSFWLSNINYVIYSGILVVIAIIVFIISINPPKNEVDIYNNELVRILKTYDAILSKIKDFPELKNRNIISLNTIDDLINAQSEIRKPIYYMEEVNSCIFFIVDDDNMIYFVLRKNSDCSNQIDEWAKLQQQKIKDKVISDSNLLDEIDKTTIVKLSNRKSFKVSPIREKENLNVQYTFQSSERDNTLDCSKFNSNNFDNKANEIKEAMNSSIGNFPNTLPNDNERFSNNLVNDCKNIVDSSVSEEESNSSIEEKDFELI